jgi:hypothetical protein
LVCHADLCLENIVVRQGKAVAVIDFDLATPADPLFDIAIAARHWIPLRDPAHIADARREMDLIRRFRLFTDAHRLDATERDPLIGSRLVSATTDGGEGEEEGMVFRSRRDSPVRRCPDSVQSLCAKQRLRDGQRGEAKLRSQPTAHLSDGRVRLRDPASA